MAGTTARWDSRAIFQHTLLAFDAGDKANASLYLCGPSGHSQIAMLGQAIDALRIHCLWSRQEPKWVRDDQRQAYQDQLRLVNVVSMQWKSEELLLVHCDHPQFPSFPQRFVAWRIALEIGEDAATSSNETTTN